MDPTLREVIEYYVARGYALATLTPDARATLLRAGSELRLRLEGRWVRIEESLAPQAAPATPATRARGPWLGLLAAALAVASVATVVAVALLLVAGDDEPGDTVARPTETATPATATPSPTASPPATPTSTATAEPSPTVTATPSPTATPPVTPTVPAIETALHVGDQLLGPRADAITIEEASDAEPFYVVVFGGDASVIGEALGASALLAPGTHGQVSVPLRRPLEDGEQVWVALHSEQNGNTSFDGPAIDRARTEGVTGSRGPQGQVATRIGVTVGAPVPPVSGGAGAAGGPSGAPLALVVMLAAAALAIPIVVRAAGNARR